MQQRKRTSLRAVSSLRAPRGISCLVWIPHKPFWQGGLHGPYSPQVKPGPSRVSPPEQANRMLVAPMLSLIPPRIFSTRKENLCRYPPGGHQMGSDHSPHLEGKKEGGSLLRTRQGGG